MILPNKNLFMSILILVCFIFICDVGFVSAVLPNGATVNPLSNSTASVGNAGSHAAVAGNVTELNIVGFTTTQSWQGYFGNVTGTIQLAAGSDSVFYNWSLASPEGEIYASTNDSVSWTNIQCFNFSADGTYASDAAQRGGTSLHGTNLTQLEDLFNIEYDDVDGVDETFTLSGLGTHNRFFTNNLEFEEGECMSTRIFSDGGGGENDKFEEALLYDPDTRSVVFASLLNENILGFDGSPHDFEMLVLEDGHLGDTSVTPYYFYLELQ